MQIIEKCKLSCTFQLKKSPLNFFVAVWSLMPLVVDWAQNTKLTERLQSTLFQIVFT